MPASSRIWPSRTILWFGSLRVSKNTLATSVNGHLAPLMAAVDECSLSWRRRFLHSKGQRPKRYIWYFNLSLAKLRDQDGPSLCVSSHQKSNSVSWLCHPFLGLSSDWFMLLWRSRKHQKSNHKSTQRPNGSSNRHIPHTIKHKHEGTKFACYNRNHWQ